MNPVNNGLIYKQSIKAPNVQNSGKNFRQIERDMIINSNEKSIQKSIQNSEINGKFNSNPNPNLNYYSQSKLENHKDTEKKILFNIFPQISNELHESFFKIPTLSTDPNIEDFLKIEDLSIFYQDSNPYNYLLKNYNVENQFSSHHSMNIDIPNNGSEDINQRNDNFFNGKNPKQFSINHEYNNSFMCDNFNNNFNEIVDHDLGINLTPFSQSVGKITEGNNHEIQNEIILKKLKEANKLNSYEIIKNMMHIPNYQPHQDQSLHQNSSRGNPSIIQNEINVGNNSIGIAGTDSNSRTIDSNHQATRNNFHQSISKIRLADIMKWKDCREKYLESHIERLKCFKYANELYKMDNILKNYLNGKFNPYFSEQIETVELFCWIWILRLEKNYLMFHEEEESFRNFLKENMWKINYWVAFELCQSSARFFKFYLPMVSIKWKEGIFSTRETIIRLTPFLQWMTGKKREKVLLFFQKNNLLLE